MNQEYKVGDVVRLRSGGPKMTVINPKTDDGEVMCEWFDKDQKIQHASFAAATLVIPAQPATSSSISSW